MVILGVQRSCGTLAFAARRKSPTYRTRRAEVYPGKFATARPDCYKSAMTTHRLCELKDAPAPGQGKPFHVGDTGIALFNVDGAFYAIHDSCPHMYFPLHDGDLERDVVSCAYHGWQFDVKTGKSLMSDHICVASFPVESKDDALWVQLPDDK
jgi:nitrite reductase (NADH) small subunit